MESNILKKIKERLRGSVTGVTHDPQLYPPLDIIDSRDRTQLEEHAKKDGVDNIPATDSNHFSSCEQSIIGHIKTIAGRYASTCAIDLGTYTETISEIASAADLQTLDNQMQQYVSDIKADSEHKIISPLFKTENGLKATKNSILNFRKDNGLMRRVPNPAPGWWDTYSLIVIFGVTELFLAYFSLEASVGVREKITVALVYSTFNLGAAFTLGGFARNINHSKITRKICGWFAVILFFWVILFINLLIGHYRAAALQFQLQEGLGLAEMAASLEITQLNSIAMDRFQESPFGLGDLQAAMLTGLGILFAIIAYQKGYGSKDPYPGYTQKVDMWSTMFDEYIDEVNDGIIELQEMRQDATDEIEELIKDLDSEINSIPKYKELAKASSEDCRNAINLLTENCNQLLQEYRQTNRRNRTTTAPSYFDENYSFAEIKIPAFKDFETSIDQNKITERIQGYANRLHKHFDESVQQLKRTKDVLENEFPFSVKQQPENLDA